MTATRNTGTALQDAQGNNRTATHLSTNIIIKVDGNVVGAVKSLEVTEARTIKMIDEVGTDGHIDSAPSASTNITGSCQRTRFDKMRIAEAFSRGFIHVHAQRIPFDLEIQDIFADSDPGNAIITTIRNVWIKDIRYTYSADDFIIVDNMSWEAEGIFSVLNNNNVAQSVSNGRANPIILNQFEQQADRGQFSGALDAAGLLNAFLSDPTS
ncbi:MAG TPA: hypothetical protein VM577_03745 [Anaerovoracaceae bacterium]|nr:hypothetical protein [Anaerovoracaceae bacterium]